MREPVIDNITKGGVATVAAAEVRVILKSLLGAGARSEGTGITWLLCPDCAPGVIVDAPGADASVDVDAGSAGTLVTLADELRPGISNGKHRDPSGTGYAYKACDHEGFAVSLLSPIDASICRPTSILTSLSSLTPVFEEPAPHTPFSSYAAVNVTETSGSFTVNATSMLPTLTSSMPNASFG